MRSSPIRPTALILAVMLLTQAAALGQDRGRPAPDQPDLTIDAKARAEVIEAIVKRLQERYVFPETAKKMEAALRQRLEQGAYDSVTSARDFSRLLTEHLQEVSKDKHLRVNCSHEPLPPEPNGRPDPKDVERRRERMRTLGAFSNYGFEKVERLGGNVGYLDLRGFMSPEFAGDTAAAAMNFLANTDALIIDLRKNGGGHPAMVALVCSYLFPAEPATHLNDLYFRPANETTQYWTLPYVPGRRYVGKDVYILTSKRTFSAAEEFTYNLKNLKRATIVGETTGGGAHPGGMARLTDHFGMFVPSGRAINPVTKTNWEGTGVTPDVEVPADQALAAAHLDALRKLLDKAPDEARKRDIRQTIEELEKGQAKK
jgi:hypothetical protein